MPSLALLDPTEIHLAVRTDETHLKGLAPVKQRLRTALFVTVVVCGNLTGNVLLRAGVSRSTALPSLAPMAYLNALLNPWLLVGVLLLIIGVAAQLTLLSWADLSYVGPVTSIGYALSALAGKLFFHEPLSAARWAAICLITAGVVLVSRTPASMTGADGYGYRR